MTEDLTRGNTEGAELLIGQASVVVGRPAAGETV